MWSVLILLVGACHAMPRNMKAKVSDQDVPTSTSSFLIIGDYGSTSRSAAERVAAAMNTWARDNNPNFILSLGDNFYNDGPASVSDRLFDDRWANVYTGQYINDLIWFISVGNHDYYPYEGYEWNEVLRTQTPGERKWYLPWLWYKQSLNTPAGVLDIIVVDSQAARKNMNDRNEMYAWYQDTLRDSDNAGNMKIVVCHHPSRAAGNYYPGSGTIQNNIEPYLSQYNVDFFLNGHDHNMQHISYKNGNGPEILVIGGGGAGLYSEDSSARSGLDSAGFNLEYFGRTYGFAGCTISSSGINIEYFDDSGRSIYSVFRARK